MLIDHKEIDSYVAGEIINQFNFAGKMTSMTSVVDALEYKKNIK